MSINSILNQYSQFTQNQNVQNGAQGTEASYEDGILTFTEADGSKQTINSLDLSSTDIEMLSSILGIEITDETKEGDNEARTDELKDSADKKQAEIEKTSDEIKEIYDETLDEQEKITKNEYQRILDLVNTSVAQFLEARKSGKQVDIEELNSTIMQGVEDSTYEKDISNVFANLEGANTKMQEMSTLLMEYGSITEEAKLLDAQKIEALQSEPNSAISEAELAAIETSSLGFLCSNFFEVGTEKLNGHKEQYNLISGFRELDDGIIQMYTEYAANAGATVQSLINQEENVDKKEEPKDDKKAENVKSGAFISEEEENEEDKEAKAA